MIDVFRKTPLRRRIAVTMWLVNAVLGLAVAVFVLR